MFTFPNVTWRIKEMHKIFWIVLIVVSLSCDVFHTHSVIIHLQYEFHKDLEMLGSWSYIYDNCLTESNEII